MKAASFDMETFTTPDVIHGLDPGIHGHMRDGAVWQWIARSSVAMTEEGWGEDDRGEIWR